MSTGNSNFTYFLTGMLIIIFLYFKAYLLATSSTSGTLNNNKDKFRTSKPTLNNLLTRPEQ